MSDWLDRKLAQDLAPVAAPHELAARLGFAPAKRRELSRAVLTAAAAVVLLVGGGYTAARTAAPGLGPLSANQRAYKLSAARVDVPLVAAGSVPPAAFRLLRCDGGAGMRPPLTAGKATVLLAHAGSSHALYAAPEAGCHQCHSL